MHHFGPAGADFRDIWATQAILSYKVAPSLSMAAGWEFGLNRNAPKNTFMTGLVFLIDNRRGVQVGPRSR